MGLWTTSYVFGSMAANMVAGYLLGHYGWREIFLVTGIAVIVVGIIQGIFLVNRPEDLGMRVDRPEVTATVGVKRGSFALMIREPAVLWLGLTYTGLKFVRYSFFAWSPYYLVSSVGLAKDTSAYVTNGFEMGGIFGLLIGGVVGDRYFSHNRVRLALAALLGLIAAVLLYRVISVNGGIWGNVCGLAAIGFFLYIADSIVSGTAGQDIGGAENTASATGIINGIGSTAQLFAGIVPIWLKNMWGWDAVFISFIILTIFSCLVILPVARKSKLSKA